MLQIQFSGVSLTKHYYHLFICSSTTQKYILFFLYTVNLPFCSSFNIMCMEPCYVCSQALLCMQPTLASGGIVCVCAELLYFKLVLKSYLYNAEEQYNTHTHIHTMNNIILQKFLLSWVFWIIQTRHGSQPKIQLIQYPYIYVYTIYIQYYNIYISCSLPNVSNALIHFPHIKAFCFKYVCISLDFSSVCSITFDIFVTVLIIID